MVGQSEKLRDNFSNVKEPVIRAVETLARQPRQTVADIAATAGLSLSETTDEAVKLAALTGASIDVTDDGDIAYRFPKDVRGALRSRSARAAFSLAWQRIAPALFAAVRIGFGALLIVSIVVTFLAIAALSAAGSRDDDRRDSRSASMFGPRVYFGPDVFDIMFYSRYGYRRREPPRDPSAMSFLEAVYSFVFGDGDPNAGFDDRRWRAVAAVIRANRGAVTAEQLAPLLDPPSRLPEDDSNFVDENFVLPALTRFQGHPEVTDDGDIIYVFPSFMTTGARGGAGSVEIVGSRSTAPAVEQEIPITRANSSQRALVVALGFVNVVGVAFLGSKLGTMASVTPDAAQFVGFVRSIYPALCAYAASFVTVPLFRFFRNRKQNAEIRARNQARAEAARDMAMGRPDLRRKLRAAERFIVRGKRVTADDVVYSSDRDSIDQIKLQEDFTEDFDRRLNS